MKRGRIELGVWRDLGKPKAAELSGLAAAAVSLARLLDDPTTPARDAASVTRELRTTMETLERRSDSDSGSSFVAGLLTEVDNSEDGPSDKGRGARAVRGGAGHAADAVAAARRRRRAGG